MQPTNSKAAHAKGESIPMMDLLDYFMRKYPLDIEESCKGIFISLCKSGFIDLKVIRNYLIVQEYQEELPGQDGYSLKTVQIIANRYCMTPRQIQNILYKWEGKFRRIASDEK